jgi:CheY-like chemotaxis protein
MPTILVVDDQPEFRLLLTRSLERAGYEVVTACDGVEAFQKVLVTKPDLILLDVMMPVLDGFRVLETLRSDPEFRSIPVIMVTGRSQSRDLTRGHAHGVDVYLTKPFNREELLLVVRRLLERDARTTNEEGRTTNDQRHVTDHT